MGKIMCIFDSLKGNFMRKQDALNKMENCPTLKDIKYLYIVNLIRYFLVKYKNNEIKTIEQVVRCVTNEVPYTKISYIFDETIWQPYNPELYNNLIEFQIQLHGYIEFLPFRLKLNEQFDKPLILLDKNNTWSVT